MAQAGYTPILIYASGTATNVPAAGNLTSSASGAELAINYADGKLYYKDSGGNVQLIASKSGASGDVVGPASATDNAIVRFDGTTGKLVQNSVVTIADSTGDISGVGVLNATTLDATNIEVTNIKAKDGTAAASIADSTGKITVSTELAVDNLNLSGNTLSSTDTNGNIEVTPNGNGSVVITNNGTSNALRITQTGTGNALLVEDSANPDATPFVVNAAGQVFFGNTTSISYQTMGLAYNLGIAQIAGADGNTSSQLIAQYSTGSSVAIPTIVFAKSKNATVGSHTIVASGDSLGAVSYDGSDGTNFIEAARVWAQVDGTPGTNDMPGRLVFSTTADGGSSPIERMRIDSAGNVGIGAAVFAGVQNRFTQNITGATNAYPILADGTVQSDVTSGVSVFRSAVNTAASAFTLLNLRHFWADQGTIGAGSAVTNQYGFSARATLTGATNNYGFYSDIASGTGRWNFYAAGTAANYFAGDMQLDKTVTATGTTGAQTINKNAGTVNFAAAATSLVVTDSRVTANSIIICTVGTNDTTMKSVAAVAGAGSFTLHANAAATAETRVNFLIIN